MQVGERIGLIDGSKIYVRTSVVRPNTVLLVSTEVPEMIGGEHEARLRPAEARLLAAALIEAADALKKESGNGSG